MQVRSFSVNYFAENTYVLYDSTGEAAVIDCGSMLPAEEAMLDQFLAEHRLRLVRHLCTHLHADHLLGAWHLYRKYGLRPEANGRDASLPSIQDQARMLGLPLPAGEVAPLWTMKGGDTVSFGETTLHVLDLPGHSPGSIGYYCEEAGQVYVGDTLFAGSIGRTDLWQGDYAQLERSLHEVLFRLPGDTVVYPGHGPQTTIQYEQVNNPYI